MVLGAMCANEETYEIGHRPATIGPTPRDSTHGQVIDEVGVWERGSGNDYWKVFQLIDDDGVARVRTGYYSSADGESWDWARSTLLLRTDIYNKLHARAVSEGILEA